MRWWFWLSLVCACWTAAYARVPPAAAQATATTTAHARHAATLPQAGLIALLPMAANPGESKAHLHAASQAIAQRLRKDGFRLLSPREVDSSLSQHALESCKTAATCDPMLALVTLGADAVVSTALWRRSGDGGAPQLVVHVRHRGGYGQGEVNAAGNELAAIRTATLLALAAALEDSRQVHELKVLVESSPARATVHVDQTLSGTTPARFELLPGSHLISVEAPGYVTRAQYLELSEQAPAETRLQIRLDRPVLDHIELPPAASPDEQRDQSAGPQLMLTSELERSPGAGSTSDNHDSRAALNYVLAAALLGVSLPFLANASYAAATHGDCVGSRDARGFCAERVVFGPLFFVSLGIGIAAAVSGSAFLLFEPIHTTSEPLPPSAQAISGSRAEPL